MSFRVAVLDDYQRVALSLGPWRQLDPSIEVTCFHDHVDDREQLVNRLQPFDAVVAMRERTAFGRDVLSCLPALRLLVTKGMANAVIDVAAANELGIMVCGTGGWAGATATVELTWALILGLARDVPKEDAGIRHGAWQLGIGTQLGGKTIGIVGLGNIGSLIPPVGRALGMRVDGVESQPDRRTGGRRRCRATRPRRVLLDVRCRHRAPQAERSLARLRRTRRVADDEADGLAGQHVPGSGRR